MSTPVCEFENDIAECDAPADNVLIVVSEDESYDYDHDWMFSCDEHLAECKDLLKGQSGVKERIYAAVLYKGWVHTPDEQLLLDTPSAAVAATSNTNTTVTVPIEKPYDLRTLEGKRWLETEEGQLWLEQNKKS